MGRAAATAATAAASLTALGWHFNRHIICFLVKRHRQCKVLLSIAGFLHIFLTGNSCVKTFCYTVTRSHRKPEASIFEDKNVVPESLQRLGGEGFWTEGNGLRVKTSFSSNNALFTFRFIFLNHQWALISVFITRGFLVLYRVILYKIDEKDMALNLNFYQANRTKKAKLWIWKDWACVFNDTPLLGLL